MEGEEFKGKLIELPVGSGQALWCPDRRNGEYAELLY